MRTKELITGFSRRMVSGAGAGTVKIFAASLMATAVILSGCSQDDDPGGEGGRTAATFNAGITATRTTSDGDAWTTTDRVGIFMVSAGGNLATATNMLADNVEHTVTNTSTGALSSAGGTIYYPQSGNVDFMAYYPFGTVSADYKYTISVAGQTSAAAQNALDVLYARKTGVAKTKTAVGLTFDHVLSKVTFSVMFGDGFSPTESAVTAVSFTGMPATGTLALQNGTLAAGAVGDFPALKAATMPTIFTAILIPQPQNNGATSAGLPDFTGRTAVFTVNGAGYAWTIPDTETFAAGNHYVYPVTVKKTGVTVGAPTITTWTTNDNGTGTAQAAEIQPEANSYMVTPGGAAILIPVSQANRALTADGLGATTTGLGGVTAGNYTVELVWSDTQVKAGGVIEEMFAYGNYICVKPGIAGNAVIGIRADGIIKWSWHIWVTQPVGSATDLVTGFTWMDRHLGAAGTTYDNDGRNGLFYQWGRKDAFPASTGTNENVNQRYFIGGSSAGTMGNLPTGQYTELSQLVQNPLNFATNPSTYCGSLDVTVNNDSWGGVSGVKTIYDPCPAGWKVPPMSVGTSAGTKKSWGSSTADSNTDWDISGFSTKKGALFNGNSGSFSNPGTFDRAHFYPAAGYRHYNNGVLGSVSSLGYCWSASDLLNTIVRNAYFLHINDSSVSLELNDARASGVPVRCVRE